MERLSVPSLCEKDGRRYLSVGGKPFFLRAGEIHNSSASTQIAMEKNVWPYLRKKGLNALAVPVYWECIEPCEGKFDFSTVDAVILRAREEGLKLVLLWFGLWKNGASDYCPGWVKRDGKRFFRVLDQSGRLPVFREQRILTISPLCGDAVKADAGCFAKLMEHIASFDGARQTVLMVQVENEIGVLGCARDHSPAAQASFEQAVPRELGGAAESWADRFGDDAAEKFMAWHYARGVEQIASAGKRRYPLPMYCNAWLRQTPRTAGEYPSGGPQLHNLDIWHKAAPSIDFYSPDIYLPEFRRICDQYAEAGEPLFIPEARRTVDAASYCLYAAGRHGAIGFSPFGIEDMMGRPAAPDPQTLRLLDISADAMCSGSDAGSLLTSVYRMLDGMGSVLMDGILEGRTAAFWDQGEAGIDVPLCRCVLRFEYGKAGSSAAPLSAGLIVELNEEEILILALNCGLNVVGRQGREVMAERYEEGTYTDGVWQCERILNGDERCNIRFHTQPRMLRLKIFALEG